MSTTLSTSAMIARLQGKQPIGLSPTQCLDFLNEGFRRINQMSKGGFIWQVKRAAITLNTGINYAAPPGAALPADFDPGKSAWVNASTNYSGYFPPSQPPVFFGLIPYKTMQEFIKDQNFQATIPQQLLTTPGVESISSWTFLPNFSLGPPTSYGWSMLVNPIMPGAGFQQVVTLELRYHAVSFPPFTNAANVFFPTPDQFDSFIIDLAEAEVMRQYGKAGWEKIASQAQSAIADMIDTYRTDRYDLSGLSDQLMQSQEKTSEGAK